MPTLSSLSSLPALLIDYLLPCQTHRRMSSARMSALPTAPLTTRVRAVPQQLWAWFVFSVSSHPYVKFSFSSVHYPFLRHVDESSRRWACLNLVLFFLLVLVTYDISSRLCARPSALFPSSRTFSTLPSFIPSLPCSPFVPSFPVHPYFLAPPAIGSP